VLLFTTTLLGSLTIRRKGNSVGIPQIVLPIWGDLYDCGTRVEYLGIGVFGSPKSASNWAAEEVGKALFGVLDGGEESMSIKEKARALGEVARKAGGRFTAAREIAKRAHLQHSLNY